MTISITAEKRDKVNKMCPIANEVGLGLFTQATTFNIKIFGGRFTVGTTGSLEVTTGINTPLSAVVTLVTTAAALADLANTAYVGYPSSGVVKLYVNACTSGTDPTLVAASATQDVNIFVYGN